MLQALRSVAVRSINHHVTVPRVLESGIVFVVQSGANYTMAFLPTPKSEDQTVERVRLTISVPADVHATFQRMADATGSSLGKTMGDWLADTEQAAQEMVKMLERAKAAPKLMVQEMHSFMLGLTEETAQLVEEVRQKSRTSGQVRGPASRGGAPAQTSQTPRSVIRGVKSPARGKGRAGGGQ